MSLLTYDIHCEIQFAKDTSRLNSLVDTIFQKEDSFGNKEVLFKMDSLIAENTYRFNNALDETLGQPGNGGMEDASSGDDDVNIPRVMPWGRRMALADIFEHVNDNEITSLLSLYVRHELARVLRNKRFCRRGGKPNILEGLSCEDLSAIRECACSENYDVKSDVTCDFGQANTNTTNAIANDNETLCLPSELSMILHRRRNAKYDVFEGLTSSQKENMLDRFQEHLDILYRQESTFESIDEADMHENDYARTVHRRGGKYDIFEGLTDEQRMNIIQTFVKDCSGNSTILGEIYFSR